MKTRRGICLTVVLALFLGCGPLHARYMNPATGRFQTMDSYEGNQQDPQSLHKYQYAADDPVNGVDPTGQLTLGELLVINGAIEMPARSTEGKAKFFSGWAAQKAIVKIGAAAGAAIIGAIYADDELRGDPPNAKQQQKLHRALTLIRADGFGKLANLGEDIRFRIVDDLVMDKEGYGYTPLFGYKVIWLDPVVLEWDDEAAAAMIIHELVHADNLFLQIGAPSTEKPCYQVESDFLWTEAITGNIWKVQQFLPRTDIGWISDTAEEMRDHKIVHPAITP